MVDKALIQRKLTLLKERQAELRGYKLKSYKEFLKGPYPKAVEKVLQELVEICLDIGKHIIADVGLQMANENRQVFETLAHHKIISKKILTTMQNMVGFRNLIIHMYEKTDTRIVFQIYKTKLKDFDQFASEIVKYLKR